MDCSSILGFVISSGCIKELSVEFLKNLMEISTHPDQLGNAQPVVSLNTKRSSLKIRFISKLKGLETAEFSEPNPSFKTTHKSHSFGSILKRVLGIPAGPIGAETRSHVVNQSSDRLAVIPI